MTIIDSTLADSILDIHITDQGNFYFLEGIVISEINEGITYTWEEAEKVIKTVHAFYGPKISVCYISNRINNYSVKPSDWLKFYRNNNTLNGYAVVTKSEKSWFNALMEKVFSKAEVERFEDLYEAIEWARIKNDLVNRTNRAS